jgi:hypothetical protein
VSASSVTAKYPEHWLRRPLDFFDTPGLTRSVGARERVESEEAAAPAETPTAVLVAPAVARVLAIQRSAGNRAARQMISRTLDDDYRAAVATPDWQRAAELLNGFSIPDILQRLRLRTPDEIAHLHQGAVANPRVGAGSNVATLTPALLTSFSRQFREPAELIRASAEAMRLIREAEAASVSYGGFAEDGPGAMAWPYTSGQSVYVPRAHTDRVVALSDFLFELNNAIRHPALDRLAADATAGRVTRGDYATGVVGQEVQGMLRLGAVWADVKATMGGGHELDRYDAPNYMGELGDVRAGRRTEAQIVQDVLNRTYTEGTLRGRTVRQNYESQYDTLHPPTPTPTPTH